MNSLTYCQRLRYMTLLRNWALYQSQKKLQPYILGDLALFDPGLDPLDPGLEPFLDAEGDLEPDLEPFLELGGVGLRLFVPFLDAGGEGERSFLLFLDFGEPCGET